MSKTLLPKIENKGNNAYVIYKRYITHHSKVMSKVKVSVQILKFVQIILRPQGQISWHQVKYLAKIWKPYHIYSLGDMSMIGFRNSRSNSKVKFTKLKTLVPKEKSWHKECTFEI